MLERVDRLKEPAVVGKFYLVPPVFGDWYGMVRDWPVIGRKHEDSEFFNFSLDHYHIDYRFLNVVTYLPNARSSPLHGKDTCPLGPIVFRRRKCLREQHVFGGPAGL